MKNPHKIHQAFKRLRRNPCHMTSAKLIGALYAGIENEAEAEYLNRNIASLEAASVAETHKMLIAGAETLGVDPITFGGGDTPEDD